MAWFGTAANQIYRFFGRHQMLKNSVMSGALMGCGDIISQHVIEKTEKHDFTRTARFLLIGTCFLGPTLHKWYGLMEKISMKSVAATALSRMVVDQVTLAPTFLYIFFWLNGGLQGFSPDTIKANISRDYKDVLISNYQFWPAVQMINFSVVPLAHRVVFAQTCALFWNTYLAWKVNRVTDVKNTLPESSSE